MRRALRIHLSCLLYNQYALFKKLTWPKGFSMVMIDYLEANFPNFTAQMSYVEIEQNRTFLLGLKIYSK